MGNCSWRGYKFLVFGLIKIGRRSQNLIKSPQLLNKIKLFLYLSLYLILYYLNEINIILEHIRDQRDYENHLKIFKLLYFYLILLGNQAKI